MSVPPVIFTAVVIVLAHTGACVPTAELQARVDAVPQGGILVLEKGTHTGPVKIARSMTIEGNGAAVIDGNRSGPVILVDAPGVTLSGLIVRNSGLSLDDDDAGILVRGDDVRLKNNRVESCLHGIYLKKVRGGELTGNTVVGATADGGGTGDMLSGGLQFDGGDTLCAVGDLDVNRRGNGIHLWNSRKVVLSGNRVSRTRDGIYFSFSDDCQVVDNVVTDCRYGLHYMYSDGNRFSGNRFSRNAAGAALMYSGWLMVAENEFSGNRGRRAYGALLQSVDASVLEGNRFIDNTVALYGENAQDNRFLGNVFTKNYIALRLGGSSRGNLHSRNQFILNTHNIESSGGATDNSWSEGGLGNRWDAGGTPDLDGDGVGEFPHRESDLLGRLRQRFPVSGLLSGSPGLELVRFANKRTKIPGVSVIIDPHPLTAGHD